MPVLVLLLVAGAVEISVLVLVGKALGVLSTLGLLVAASVLGGWLLRHEGRRALREFGEAARQRRPPERELADSVLIAGGGLLIVLPGFVSDVVGLVCLLPPTRALLRRRLQRAAERRAETFEERLRAHGAHIYAGGMRPGGGAGDVVDGEVISVDEEDTGPRDTNGPHVLPPDDPGPHGDAGQGTRPRHQ